MQRKIVTHAWWTQLIHPVIVSWCKRTYDQYGKAQSFCECVTWQSVNSWPTIMNICEENRQVIDSAVQKKVSNLALKREAEDTLSLLKPVTIALNQAQKDNCTRKSVKYGKS